MIKNNVGVILIAISIFMLYGFFNADMTGTIRVQIFAFTFCVILPFAGGVIVLLSNYQKQKNSSPENSPETE